MKKIFLTLQIFMLILQGCVSEDCEQCFTPPQSFEFEIVEKSSGENLFTNGTFNINEITITDDLNNMEPVEFSFISENNMNLIRIGSIGWKTEIVNLKVAIDDTPIFSFYVDTERKMGDCCSYNQYNEISVTDSEFELDSQTGIYKILQE